MKAILLTSFGPPSQLTYGDAPVPVPKDDEALVQVVASSVNPADYYRVTSASFLVRLFSGNGLFKPKRPLTGSDVAGVVRSVGRSVRKFHPGDEVVGMCLGAYAEYVTVPEKDLARKPANVSFAAAGTLPIAGYTALQALRTHGGVAPGMKVLICGASGGVGHFAIQLAKALGAEVTAVCSSGKVEAARALGANQVLDYTRENFADRPDRYDVILVINGRHPLREYRHVLAPGGVCVMIGGAIGQILRVLLLGKLRGRSRPAPVRAFIAKSNSDDLEFLLALLASGRVRPTIDDTYPLPEVPRALDRLHEGPSTGKIAISVAPAPPSVSAAT